MHPTRNPGSKPEATEPPSADGGVSTAPRVVYRIPPIALGTVTGRQGSQYEVRAGATTSTLDLDPSVDPALVEEAMEQGRRVVIDPASNTICGLLQTSRTLTVDPNGDVRSSMRRLELDASERVLLRTPTSFLLLDDERAEIFAREALVRARGAVRALARLIKLN